MFGYDLDVPYLAEPVEQHEQVAFHEVRRDVADENAIGDHSSGIV